MSQQPATSTPRIRTEGTDDKEPLSNSTSRPAQIQMVNLKSRHVTISASKVSKQPSLRQMLEGQATPILRNQVSFVPEHSSLAKGFSEGVKYKFQIGL